MKTKKELDSLKVIEQEPYQNVIKRLIDYFKEDLTLSDETKKLISDRVDSVEKGNVMSTKELFKRFVDNKNKQKKK